MYKREGERGCITGLVQQLGIVRWLLPTADAEKGVVVVCQLFLSLFQDRDLCVSQPVPKSLNYPSPTGLVEDAFPFLVLA